MCPPYMRVDIKGNASRNYPMDKIKIDWEYDDCAAVVVVYPSWVQPGSISLADFERLKEYGIIEKVNIYTGKNDIQRIQRIKKEMEAEQAERERQKQLTNGLMRWLRCESND